jgi:transglutaminase-like putative cysteine protease
LEAVLDLTQRIHADFKFDPKATTLATPLEDVLKNRRGVCQDFAQLEICCLRSLGLPARYVSGYLETVPPPGKPRFLGADASHAWASFYCHNIGWIAIDPTNDVMPASRHITVAYGRDYSDVSPIRGVILGAGEHTLKVAVDVVAMEAVSREKSADSLAATTPS